MGRRFFVLAAAMSLAPPAWAASAYTELLQHNFAATLDSRNDPKVPDDVELKMLKCLAAAFINANIPPNDLAKLDQAVTAGTIQSDPLAGKYAMLAGDPGALTSMSAEAARLCPEILKAVNDAKTSD
jgi:hypothetical protein